MSHGVRVKFGTTEDQVRSAVLQKCQEQGIDIYRVHYVIDLNACTLDETAYAFSEDPAQLPPHPGGPSVVRKLLNVNRPT